MRLNLTATLITAAAIATGCADDIATRDYTLDACPARPRDPTSLGVCDRGAGQVPRLVPVESCVMELGGDTSVSWGFLSTHPAYERCRPWVTVATLDDIRAGLHLRGQIR